MVTTLLLVLAVWCVVAAVVAPTVGRFLARRDAALEQCIARHPAGRGVR